MAADTSPGIGASQHLNTYWTSGKGRALWADSATPYRTLLALLLEYMSSAKAHGLAAEYYHVVYGVWPGQHEGKH